jgi:hypothetical protein
MKSIITLTATLALAITFTLTACEEKKKQDGTTTKPPETTSETEATPTQEATVAVEKPQENVALGTFTDTYDGRIYKTVKIGEQVWMAENLNSRIGNSVCYDNNEANCRKYGRLYDWETAKKACPKGWHLPSYAEWDKLDANKHEFFALPGGEGYSGGYFDFVGYRSNWWSASEIDSNFDKIRRTNYSNYAYNRRMYYDHEVRKTLNDKGYLFSVRCLQDGTDTKPQETARESQPSSDEECPYKEGPIIITEAVFLGEAEDHEGRSVGLFSLPSGKEITLIGEINLIGATSNNVKKGDKVSVTYKEELDTSNPECLNLYKFESMKKISAASRIN